MRSASAVVPPVDEGGFFRKLSVAIMGDDSTAQLEDDIAALRSAHADGDGADGSGGGGGGGMWRRMSAAVAEVFGDDDADLERAAADNLGQTDPMAAAVMRSQQGSLLKDAQRDFDGLGVANRALPIRGQHSWKVEENSG